MAMPAQNQRRRPSLTAELGTPGSRVYTNGNAEAMRARHVLEHHRPLDIKDQTIGSGTR